MGLPYTVKVVDITRGEQHAPAFEAISPNLKIPVIVDPQGPGGKPISVFVPSEIIQEAGEDPKLEVTYCIIDRVGNNSRWAPARTLKVGANKLYVNTAPREVLRAAETRPNWRN